MTTPTQDPQGMNSAKGIPACPPRDIAGEALLRRELRDMSDVQLCELLRDTANEHVTLYTDRQTRDALHGEVSARLLERSAVIASLSTPGPDELVKVPQVLPGEIGLAVDGGNGLGEVGQTEGKMVDGGGDIGGGLAGGGFKTGFGNGGLGHPADLSATESDGNEKAVS